MEVQQNNSNKTQNYKTIGMVVIGLGLLMLLNLMLKLVSVEFVSDYWALVVILTGFLIMGTGKNATVPGLVVVVCGILLVAIKNDWLNSTAGHALEALVVAILGLLLIMKVGDK